MAALIPIPFFFDQMHAIRQKLTAMILFAMLACGNSQVCAELVIMSTAGDTYQADAYTNIGTTSANMVGMRVTMNFSNGTSDSGIWTATGISQNNWSITQGPGTTYTYPFTLTNNTRRRITSFVMHGRGSTTIFDRSQTRSSPNSTPGTFNGRDLQEFTNLSQSQDIVVNYFDNVQTTGSTPVGDIFVGMEVAFQTGIRRNGGQFIFRTDTDNTANLLEPLSVPEPATALKTTLLVLGILVRRRPKRNPTG